jgi:hypothetical protein
MPTMHAVRASLLPRQRVHKHTGHHLPALRQRQRLCRGPVPCRRVRAATVPAGQPLPLGHGHVAATNRNV